MVGVNKLSFDAYKMICREARKALFLLYKQVVSSYKVLGISRFCNNLFIFKRFSDLAAVSTL